jgi:hypothetical protein
MDDCHFGYNTRIPKNKTDVNYQWKFLFWVRALISLKTHAHAFQLDLNLTLHEKHNPY